LSDVSVGTLYATLKLDKGQFERAVQSGGLSFGGLAKVALASGAVIGGALLGIGIASTKSAADFQASMELISTQAGASQAEIEQLKGSVLGLAGQVGAAPEELAAGLYHLESAGLRGAAAMDVLKIAAEGAKVGHADLETVTNSLVAALQSGVGGVTDASQAMGVLNAIVGAGNMRMDDLTAAIGTGVLSAAKNFGVSIQSVGAALASMTDQGIPAVDAANAIRAGMRLMAAPTSAAVKELKSIGLTSTSLAGDLRGPGGIEAAMVDLKSHMEAAGLSATEQAQLLTKAFGGKQSQGILTLIGNLDLLDAKTKAVTAGTGGFADAWAKTQEEVSVKADKAKASFEALSITLGDKLLPIAGSVFDGITALLSSPALTGAIDGLGNAMSGLATLFGQAFGAIAGVIGPPIAEIVGLFTDATDGSNTIIDDFHEMAAAGDPLAAVVGMIAGAFTTFTTTILPQLQTLLASVATNILPALGNAFTVIVTGVLPVLQSAFETFTTSVLPTVTSLFDFLATTVIPSVGSAISWIATNVLPPLMAAFSTIADTIIPILAAAFSTVVHVIEDNWPTISAIAETVGNAVKTAVEAISVVIKAVAPVITWLAKTIFPILGAAAGILLHVIDGAFKAIGVVWNAAWDVAKGIAKGIGDAFGNLVGVFNTVGAAISGVFRGAMNFLIGIVNGIIKAVDAIQVHIGRIGLDTPAGFIGVGPFDWNGLQLPTLRYLAGGGIVDRPTLAMLGEGNKREAVIPLDSPTGRALAGGEQHTHYHVQVMGNVEARDEPSIARTLQRLASVSPVGAGTVLAGIQRATAVGSAG